MRLVFYFPGYDLRPVHQSFRLIRSEFENFLKIRNVEGKLSEFNEGCDPSSFTSSWIGKVEWPGTASCTRFVQLGWRDVIRPDFQRSWPRTVLDAIRSFWLYARAGGYAAALRSNILHGLFCLYPAVGLCLYFAMSLLPPLLLAPMVLRSVASSAPQDYAGLLAWLALLACSSLWFAAIYALVTFLEPKTYFRYLTNSWHFMARLAHNDHDEMKARIEDCADLIVAMEAEAAEDEELVFVSHSCGTFVAIYIMAAVLRRQPDIGQRPGGFAFVTLGPAFDCLGGFGAEHGFGEAMATVAGASVDWTDLYGPHDPLCGGRTPPVARYARPASSCERMDEPRRFSVCIPDRMTSENFRRLRFRFFPLHFNYFFASVRPGLFDFYRLTLGPRRAVDQLKAWDDGQD
jgi:hypothetical protein